MKVMHNIHWLIMLAVNLLQAEMGLSYIPYSGGIKLLHVGFHTGCIKDFEDVVKELHDRGYPIDLTSWNVAKMVPRKKFDGLTASNAIWNISHKRAYDVWEHHKHFFDQFDMVVTSDTAPLSRIFLQHGWEKPLIIWICNRFDYCDWQTRDESFPDPEYYTLFQSAAYMSNVCIVPYTDYEWYYAESKGLRIGRRTIRPLGSLDDSNRFGVDALIPESVVPEKTLFLYPRQTKQQVQFALSVCQKLDIPCYTGAYNGPGELKNYKAVLYFPYAWSNVAFYENIQRGIVHFVPSPQFIKELLRKNAPVRVCTQDQFELCEWYKPEYKHIIVYFDSWDDLKKKFERLDYKGMQRSVMKFGKKHRAEVLLQWEQVFNELIPMIP